MRRHVVLWRSPLFTDNDDANDAVSAQPKTTLRPLHRGEGALATGESRAPRCTEGNDDRDDNDTVTCCWTSSAGQCLTTGMLNHSSLPVFEPVNQRLSKGACNVRLWQAANSKLMIDVQTVGMLRVMDNSISLGVLACTAFRCISQASVLEEELRLTEASATSSVCCRSGAQG